MVWGVAFLLLCSLVFLVKHQKTQSTIDQADSKGSTASAGGKFSGLFSKFGNDSSPMPTSNEILQAAIKQKELTDWTNMWYFAEAGKGDPNSLRSLTKIGVIEHRAEVMQVLKRIIENPEYGIIYRMQAMNWYPVVTDGQVENSAVPSLIKCLLDPNPNISREAGHTMDMMLEGNELTHFIGAFEKASMENPNNRALSELLRVIQSKPSLPKK